MTELEQSILADLQSGAVDKVVAQNARAMARLEAIWRAAAAYAEGKPEAGDALEIHFMLKALHCKMDALANRAAGVIMPESGGR